MEDENIVQRSTSAWNAPVICVKKKSGVPGKPDTLRMVTDFRGLNRVLQNYIQYPIPSIHETLADLSTKTIFSTLDLELSFFTLFLNENDRKKTAFSHAALGKWEYTRLPMGSVTSAFEMQNFVQSAFKDFLGKSLHIYIDDFLISSRGSLQDHIQDLKPILETMVQNKLRLNPYKCKFALDEVKYLGFLVSANGVKPDPGNVAHVTDIKTLVSVKEIKAFLGLANFYSEHIPDFWSIAAPLVHLTKKDVKFQFDEQCVAALERLKHHLITEPIMLKYPKFDQTFVLAADCSCVAIGAVLSQRDVVDGKPMERVISYYSKLLNSAQRNYSSLERELLACVVSIKHFNYYLRDSVEPFVLITDARPLTFLQSLKDPEGRLWRWAQILSTYRFTVEHRAGQIHQNADGLSRITSHLVGAVTRGQAAAQRQALDFCAGEEMQSEPANESDSRELEEPLWIPVVWDLAGIRQEQHNDPQIKGIMDSIGQGNKHELYFINSEGTLGRNDPTGRYGFQIYVPKSMRERLMHQNHNQGCHYSYFKTLHLILRQYFWPQMGREIKEYCSACHGCFVNKRGPTMKPNLQKFTEVTRPFQRCGMDITGPYVRVPTEGGRITASGNKYSLNFICHFSRYCKSIAISDQKGETIAKHFVTEIVLVFGAPEALLTDLGRSLVKGVMEETCKILRIDRLFTTPYKASTNSMIEKYHLELGNIIRQLAENDPINWDKALAPANFAHNTSIHVSTTPYFLVFGRDPIMPLALVGRTGNREYVPEESFAQKLVGNLKKAYKVAVDQIAKSVLVREKYFNKGKHDYDIKVGDIVYHKVEHMKRGQSKKLVPRFHGPLRVTEVVNKVNVRVEKIIDKQVNDKPILTNICKLRKAPRVVMPDGTQLPGTEAQWIREDIGEEVETSEVARESGHDSGDASSTVAQHGSDLSCRAGTSQPLTQAGQGGLAYSMYQPTFLQDEPAPVNLQPPPPPSPPPPVPAACSYSSSSARARAGGKSTGYWAGQLRAGRPRADPGQDRAPHQVSRTCRVSGPALRLANVNSFFFVCSRCNMDRSRLLILFLVALVTGGAQEDEDNVYKMEIIKNRNLSSGVIFAKEAEFFVSRTDFVLIHKVDTIHKYVVSLNDLESKLRPLLSVSKPIVPIPKSITHEVQHMLSEIATLRYLIHGIAMTAPSTEQEKHIKFKRSLPEPVVNSKKVKGGQARLRKMAFNMAYQIRSCAESFTVPSYEKNTFLGRVLQDGPKATEDGKCYVTCFTPAQLDQANRLFAIMEEAKYVKVPYIRKFNVSTKTPVLQNLYNMYDYLMDDFEMTRIMDPLESEFRWFYGNYLNGPYLTPIKKNKIKKSSIVLNLPVKNTTGPLYSIDVDRLLSDEFTEDQIAKSRAYAAPVMARVLIANPGDYHFLLNPTTEGPNLKSTKIWENLRNENFTLTTAQQVGLTSPRPLPTTTFKPSVTTKRNVPMIRRTTASRPQQRRTEATKRTVTKISTTTGKTTTAIPAVPTFQVKRIPTTPKYQYTQDVPSNPDPISFSKQPADLPTTEELTSWISTSSRVPSPPATTARTTTSDQTAPTTTTPEPYEDWFDNPFGSDFVPIRPESGDTPPPSKLLRPTALFAAIFNNYEKEELRTQQFMNYFAKSWADAKKRRQDQHRRRQRPVPTDVPVDPLEELNSTAPTTRGKRSLLPLGGSILRGLFGVMDSKDRAKINKAFQDMSTSQKKLLQLAKMQAAVIDVTSTSDKMSELNVKRIAQVLEIVKKTITGMETQSTNATIIRNFHMDLAATLRELHGILESVRSDIRAFLTAWDSLLQGRLPHYLVSPTHLHNVLQELVLPEGTQLPLKVSAESIHQYYNLISTSPVHDGTQLYVYYHVPLISNGKMYELFRNLPWPTQVNNSNIYYFYKPRTTYLAVSKDRQTHINLEMSQLHNCRGEGVRICSPAAPIFRAPMSSCAFALFMSQEDQVKILCERMLVKDPAPRFYGGSQGRVWAYGLSKPLQVSLYYGTGLPIPSTPPLRLTGTGLLQIPAGTIAVANGVSLVAEQTYYYREQVSDLDNFIIPTLPVFPVLAPVTAPNTVKSELARSTEQLLNGSSSDILTAKSESQLRQLLEESRTMTIPEYISIVPTHTWIISALGTTLILTTFGIFIYCKFFATGSAIGSLCRCCSRRNVPRRQVSISIVENPTEVEEFTRPDVDRQVVIYTPRHHSPRYVPTDDALF